MKCFINKGGHFVKKYKRKNKKCKGGTKYKYKATQKKTDETKEPEGRESKEARGMTEQANVTMNVGKVCLTEEIITNWRQKKKKREGKERKSKDHRSEMEKRE